MRRSRRNKNGNKEQSSGDDGWEQWGGYFNAKKAKLDKQFKSFLKDDDEDSAPTTSPDDVPQIFRGVSVYINGYTCPPEPELRSMFIKHGGNYATFLGSRVNFVIASNLPMGKKKILAGKTIKADWIVDSVKAGTKLDHRNYMLYNLNAENKQSTLSQMFVKPNTAEVKEAEVPTSAQASSSEEDSTPIKVDEIEVSNPGPRSSSSGNHEEHESEDPHPSEEKDSPKIETSNSGDAAFASLKLKTAGEDGFLEDFYNNSRLHLISTMKKEVQLMVSDWRRDSGHKLPLAEDYADSLPLVKDSCSEDIFNSPTGKVLFHVDLDCFFVAVGLLTRPHLRNKPIVVTHSKGSSKTDSRSDVSCASYEARAKGVKAGMWLHQAKNLCPEVEAIPYEFEEYKRVSKLFYETVGSLTLEMEPISIDEMVVDVTHILRETSSSPMTLAAFLRNAIQTEAKINASIGIGCNKLAAKLSTRVAKDTHVGEYFMKDSEVREHIRSQSVKKLPGVGWATADRLSTQFNVETGKQLEALSMEELRNAFGVKTGEKLYSICRGIDKDTVNCESTNAKSLSAGCSWGVRFTKYEDLEKFIKDLASEISQRATKSKCFGSKLSLSLWVVRKGYLSVTIKPGGHGVVDISSRTGKFLQHTRDALLISKKALELARSITMTKIPADHIRGVSIAMDGLRYENEMSEKEKKTVQRTLFSTYSRQDVAGNVPLPLNRDSESSVQKLVEEEPTNNTVSQENTPVPNNSEELLPASQLSHDVSSQDVETDIFTGEAIKATPTKDVGSKPLVSTPKSPQPSTSTKTVIQSSTSALQAKPKHLSPNKFKLPPMKPIGKSSINKALALKFGAKTGQRSIADLLQNPSKSYEPMDELNPIVQQRILDSFKKSNKLPSLNGVSNIEKVHELICKGVKDRIPALEDIRCLTTYFQDLSKGPTPYPFLKQMCQSIVFLKRLQVHLAQKNSKGSAAWIKTFENICAEMETRIQTVFGGRFDYKSESNSEDAFRIEDII